MNPAQHLLRVLIRSYQILIAPVLPRSCRYAPSCSEYAIESVVRHGAVKGAFLAITRIVRCHPWGGHGHDPVPQTLKTLKAFTLFHKDRSLRFPTLVREGDGHG